MTFSIKIKINPDDVNWNADKTLDSTEFQHIKALCKNTFWGFSAQFIPIRTNNWKNFAKDFFIPAVTQSAIKIDSLNFDKIVIRFMELILDFGTLPFRAITVIPRIIYNSLYPKDKDPFYLYLKTKGLLEGIEPQQDFVYVRFEWVENINGEEKQFEQESSIGFIALPHLKNFHTKHFMSRNLSGSNLV